LLLPRREGRVGLRPRPNQNFLPPPALRRIADFLPPPLGEGRVGVQPPPQISRRPRPHPDPPPQAGEGDLPQPDPPRRTRPPVRVRRRHSRRPPQWGRE